MPTLPRCIPLLTLLLALTSAQAQRTNRSGYGVKAGVHLSNWRSGVMEFKSLPGLSLGAYVPLRVCPSLEIQPELLASVMGASTGLPDGGRSTTRLAYVQVPITAKLFLNDRLNVQGGLLTGMLLTAYTDNEASKDRFNTLDLGVTVGIGMDPRQGIDLMLRYYSGLSPLLVDDERIYPTNRMLQLTAGKRLGQFSHRRLRRR